MRFVHLIRSRIHVADWLRIPPTAIALIILFDDPILRVTLMLHAGLGVLWILANVTNLVDQETMPSSAFFPVLLDQGVLTAVVFTTGGIYSPMAFGYIAVVALSSLNIRVRQGEVCAILSILGYSTIACMMHAGVWNHENALGPQHIVSTSTLVLAIVVFSFAVLATHATIKSLTLGNAKSSQKIQATNDAMKRELAVARKIQQSLFAHRPSRLLNAEIFLSYISLQEVGGDYVDFFMDEEDNLGILLADAAGHGVPAALVAMMTKVAADRSQKEMLDPDKFLLSLNESLIGVEAHFVAACYAVYRPHERRLDYSLAGNPAPYLLRPGEPARQVSGRGKVLGIVPEPKYSVNRLDLIKGDRVVFFTDGINECRNPDGKILDDDQLASLLTDITAMNPGEDSASRIVQDLSVYTSTRGFEDDVSLVILCVL